MKEQLITFETAKLAKGKGFVGLYPTTDYIPMYVEDDETFNWELGEQQGEDDCRDNFYLAVTQSLLQKWLRDVHNISISITAGISNGKHTYECWIMLPNSKEIVPELSQEHDEKYGTVFYEWKYEDALEIGLQEALKLI